MAYTKTTWENGVTPVNADNMNKIENELEALDQRGSSGSAVGGGYKFYINADSGETLDSLILCGPIYDGETGQVFSDHNFFGWHRFGSGYDYGGGLNNYCENTVCFVPLGSNYSKTTKMSVQTGIFGYDGTSITASNIGSYINKILYLTKESSVLYID